MAAPGLVHCHVCQRPLGKALLGEGSILDVRCSDGCKHTTIVVGPFPHVGEPDYLQLRLLPSCEVPCQRCKRRLGKVLLAPGSSYEGRCRSCKLLTTMTGPWPWPSR